MVSGGLTSSLDSLVLALHGKSFLLWLLLAICGALPSLTSASCFSVITSLLLKL